MRALTGMTTFDSTEKNVLRGEYFDLKDRYGEAMKAMSTAGRKGFTSGKDNAEADAKDAVAKMREVQQKWNELRQRKAVQQAGS